MCLKEKGQKGNYIQYVDVDGSKTRIELEDTMQRKKKNGSSLVFIQAQSGFGNLPLNSAPVKFMFLHGRHNCGSRAALSL